VSSADSGDNAVTPPRIGWIGTGVMGRSMAGHLLDAGAELLVHTRTAARAEPLIERGARWAETPEAVTEDRDVVFSIVSMPADVAHVHLGTDMHRGTLAAMRSGTILVDMTTSRPDLARTLAEAGAARGIDVLDAPVSGGDVGARNAALSIMVGGSAKALERVHPLLARMGSRIVRHGGPGSGQHCKMVNQILVAAGMLGTCEALAYARAAGLNGERVIESVSSGAAGSWSISNLGPRILREDFEPGFRVDHFLKDLRIAIEESRAMNLDLPAVALAERLYDRLVSEGFAASGTQVLARIAGQRTP